MASWACIPGIGSNEEFDSLHIQQNVVWLAYNVQTISKEHMHNAGFSTIPRNLMRNRLIRDVA